MSYNTFRRYTSLPFLLDILYEKRLALLDPASWEDKNDSYFLELYKIEKRSRSVLALCFADAPETYQHWKIYSGNSSGVCIEFDRDGLLDRIRADDRFISRYIQYDTLDKLRTTPPEIDELPFIKRYAFQDENEYRIIYTDLAEEIKIKYITILPQDIECIVINPWVSKAVFSSIKSVIREIDGCRNIRIRKSTVVENDEWKALGANAVAVKNEKGK
jgi:hypothetical protein